MSEPRYKLKLRSKILSRICSFRSAILQQKAKKWNFDFVEERPLQSQELTARQSNVTDCALPVSKSTEEQLHDQVLNQKTIKFTILQGDRQMPAISFKEKQDESRGKQSMKFEEPAETVNQMPQAQLVSRSGLEGERLRGGVQFK